LRILQSLQSNHIHRCRGSLVIEGKLIGTNVLSLAEQKGAPFQFSKMFDWVGLILKVVYYYGHLIGLSNFEFDWRNGRVFTTRKSTVYSIAINVILVIIMVLQLKETDFITVFGRPNKIHHYVAIISFGLRLTAGGINCSFF